MSPWILVEAARALRRCARNDRGVFAKYKNISQYYAVIASAAKQSMPQARMRELSNSSFCS
jgi:hypothetical protein